MKLDRLKFAELIGYCANRGMAVDKTDVEVIDRLIDIDIPEVQAAYVPSTADINELMRLMAQGTHKIDAIKLYRKLTGCGLQDSKGEVEKHWLVAYTKLTG